MAINSKISDKYKYLYHYTNEAGLKGILDGGFLRATHYKDLNDKEEIVQFKKPLKKYTVPIAQKMIRESIDSGILNGEYVRKLYPLGNEASVEVEHFLDVPYKALLEQSFADPYIVSFCVKEPNDYEEDNGLLSQWKGYGNDGYALLFDTEKLEALVQMEMEKHIYVYLELVRVVYGGNENLLLEALSNELSMLAKLVCYLIQLNLQQTPMRPLKTQEFEAFLKCISQYKHEGFKEEKEVRIIGFVPTSKALEMVRRKSKSERRILRPVKSFERIPGKVVSYIEMFKDLNTELPVKKNIVGPSSNKKERAENLRRLIEGRDIKIMISQTPFEENKQAKFLE